MHGAMAAVPGMVSQLALQRHHHLNRDIIGLAKWPIV